MQILKTCAPWRRTSCALLAVALIALASCTPQSAPVSQPAGGTPPPGGQAATPEVKPAAGGLLDLPAPAVLLEQLRQEGQTKAAATAEEVRLRDGGDYSTVLPPSRVSADGAAALFAPQWSSTQDGLAALAYALYAFNLADPASHEQVDTAWEGALPASAAYIALSDFSNGRWLWYALPPSGELSCGVCSAYASPAGVMLAVVVLTGTEQQRLHWLRVGGNLPPVADLDVTPQSGMAPLDVLLDAAGSSDPEGAPLEYHWDFDGDGVIDELTSDAQIEHRYELSGQYLPSVTVRDDGDAACGASATLAVGGPPQAVLKATPDTGCAPLAVSFDATASSDALGAITLYEWDLDGDGTFELGAADKVTTAYTYEQVGDYTVRLRVTDNEAMTDQAAVLIHVTEAPVAQLTVDPAAGAAPLDVRLDASGSAHPDGLEAVKYEWDYNGDRVWDNLTLGAQSTHSYLGGVQQAHVRVTFSDGSSAVAQAQVSVSGFATSWGGSNHDYFNTAVVGAGGDIFCAGSTLGFGTYSLDGMVVKRNADGSYAWAATWGGYDVDAFYAAACDESGGMYAGGYSYSYAPAGLDDAVIVRYNSGGGIDWARSWGRDGCDWMQDMALDSAGNVWCVGQTRNEEYGSDRDFILLKYSPAGELLMQRDYNSGRTDREPYLALAPDGSMYISGRSTGNAGSGLDALLLKVSAGGELLWQKYWGGLDQDGFSRLVLDGSGQIYAVGYTMSYGGGAEDGLLAKVSAGGELLWARAWGGAESDFLTAVQLDSAGNVYTTGYLITPEEQYVAVLLKWSADGALLAQRQLTEAIYKDFWQCRKLGPDTLLLMGCGTTAAGNWWPLELPVTALVPGGGELTGTLTPCTGVYGTPQAIQTWPHGTVDNGGGGLDGVLVGYECE